MCPFCISGAVLIIGGAISIGGIAGIVANRLHLTKEPQGAFLTGLQDSIFTELEQEAQNDKQVGAPAPRPGAPQQLPA